MKTNFGIVILAAGLGTRMKSRQAKVLHRAGGKTLIALVTDTATRVAPADHTFVVVGHQAELVEQTLAGRGLRFLLQTEQLGTGHAVLIGRQELEPLGPNLLVLYGDTPLVAAETLTALMDQHVQSGAAATVLTTTLADPSGYGRILRDAAGRIRAIVEEKVATPEQKAITEINSGIYCFETRALFACLATLRPNNQAGEYYLTDVIEGLVARNRPVGGLSIAEAWQVLGINTRVELAGVDSLLRARKARELMFEGVTIQRPETVTLDDAVSIAPDSVLEPFVQVLGGSSLGSGCRIRSYSVISDSRLADEVIVEPFSWIHNSEVEKGARIGPYARLRTGSHVGPDACIGNFVELKKTRMGARSKANHLAYLGDSAIGEDVNIGAGTITCNYDGVAKHPTVIQDGAFVGSNSTLVAPVEIGPGSYLAAGSVITENVPADALAIARSRQTVKLGWAANQKKK